VHSKVPTDLPLTKRLVSIPETLLVTLIVVFQLDLTTVGLLVRPPGSHSDQRDDDDGEQTAGNASVQTWAVMRLVLESMHC
jgi:hypothetical protein